MQHPLPLCSRSDQLAARQLVEASHLRFEPHFDNLIGIFEKGRLAACGARDGRVLKMLVVAPEFRGEGLIGDIITELMRLGREAGETGFFIFSRRCATASFERLGFRQLAEHDGIYWLEHAHELQHYLARQAALLQWGTNAAVLISADPFTCGHAHLIEHAARLADLVYVFVYSEGTHQFPLPIRLELARRGVAHIANAIVTESGPYRLRAERFPRYFLTADDDADAIRINLESKLFGRHIAAPFHIRSRLVGAKPVHSADWSYHQITRSALSQWDIRLLEIEQARLDTTGISSTRVRQALRENDQRTLAATVPEAVLDFLRTPSVATLIHPHTAGV